MDQHVEIGSDEIGQYNLRSIGKGERVVYDYDSSSDYTSSEASFFTAEPIRDGTTEQQCQAHAQFTSGDVQDHLMGGGELEKENSPTYTANPQYDLHRKHGDSNIAGDVDGHEQAAPKSQKLPPPTSHKISSGGATNMSVAKSGKKKHKQKVVTDRWQSMQSIYGLGSTDEEVRAQPDVRYLNHTLVMSLDGPILRQIIRWVEADDTLCFKMRWYVARYIRQHFCKTKKPYLQDYSTNIQTKVSNLRRDIRDTRKRGKDVSALTYSGKPLNRLSFEATRATAFFKKDQPGWENSGLTRLLQMAYEKEGWSVAVTDEDVDEVLQLADADLNAFKNAPLVAERPTTPPEVARDHKIVESWLARNWTNKLYNARLRLYKKHPKPNKRARLPEHDILTPQSLPTANNGDRIGKNENMVVPSRELREVREEASALQGAMTQEQETWDLEETELSAKCQSLKTELHRLDALKVEIKQSKREAQEAVLGLKEEMVKVKSTRKEMDARSKGIWEFRMRDRLDELDHQVGEEREERRHWYGKIEDRIDELKDQMDEDVRLQCWEVEDVRVKIKDLQKSFEGKLSHERATPRTELDRERDEVKTELQQVRDEFKTELDRVRDAFQEQMAEKEREMQARLDVAQRALGEELRRERDAWPENEAARIRASVLDDLTKEQDAFHAIMTANHDAFQGDVRAEVQRATVDAAEAALRKFQENIG